MLTGFKQLMGFNKYMDLATEIKLTKLYEKS
jgi:hypothetical protein